jgi:hypothetical protein
MPVPSDFGDGATAIEGPSASIGYAHGHVASGSSRGKGAELSRSTFAKTSDYFSEDRPFVVLIGRKGVTGALQELDQQLRAVRLLSSPHFSLALSQFPDV